MLFVPYSYCTTGDKQQFSTSYCRGCRGLRYEQYAKVGTGRKGGESNPGKGRKEGKSQTLNHARATTENEANFESRHR